MKKTILTISIIFLAFFTINAQETTEPKLENPNAPEISFDKVVHDYGTIMQNGDPNCEFKFTNTGKEPLVLSNVRSSCGCTVPSWPREPILPGQSDVIKIKYATNRLGAINKNITVLSNAKTSSVVLRIKGNVIADPKENAPEKPIDENATPIAK